MPALAADWLREIRQGTRSEAVTEMNFTAPPEVQWSFLTACISMARSDDELTDIAIGPFEHLLGFHGADFIDRVEATARRSVAFARMTTAARRHMMSEDVWQRVQAIQRSAPEPLTHLWDDIDREDPTFRCGSGELATDAGADLLQAIRRIGSELAWHESNGTRGTLRDAVQGPDLHDQLISEVLAPALAGAFGSAISVFAERRSINTLVGLSPAAIPLVSTAVAAAAMSDRDLWGNWLEPCGSEAALRARGLFSSGPFHDSELLLVTPICDRNCDIEQAATHLREAGARIRHLACLFDVDSAASAGKAGVVVHAMITLDDLERACAD